MVHIYIFILLIGYESPMFGFDWVFKTRVLFGTSLQSLCVGPLVRDMVERGLLHEFEPLVKGKKKKKPISPQLCDLEVLHVTLNFKIISLGDKY